MAFIENEEAAWRLARTSASDLLAYHPDKIRQGIESDSFYEVMNDLLARDRAHYKASVSPELFAKGLFDRAVIDRIIRFQGEIDSLLW